MNGIKGMRPDSPQTLVLVKSPPSNTPARLISNTQRRECHSPQKMQSDSLHKYEALFLNVKFHFYVKTIRKGLMETKIAIEMGKNVGCKMYIDVGN